MRYSHYCTIFLFKDDVKSVLRIFSVHNKNNFGDPTVGILIKAVKVIESFVLISLKLQRIDLVHCNVAENMHKTNFTTSQLSSLSIATPS